MAEGAPGSQNKIELSKRNYWELPTDIDLVEPAGKAFLEKLRKAGWGLEEALNLELAFHEALVNAIAHGNLKIVKPKDNAEDIGEIAKREQVAHPTNKKIYITLEISERRVSVKIRDEGNGFKHEEVTDPTASEGLFKTEGRGLFLMKAFFDSVIYNKEGNEVTMVKERKS